MKKLAQRPGERRGVAAVEMAFVLPLFLMLVLGIVEFGRALMVGQLVTNSAREGARIAVITGSTNTEVEQHIEDFLIATTDVAATDVDVDITITPAPGNPDPGGQVAAAEKKDLITVRVQLPFDKVSFVAGSFLNGKNLTGQASMRHE